jgi:MFS family permease
VLLVVVLANIAVQFTNVCMAPVLPQIAQNLHVDMGVATNLMTAFIFSGSIMILFVGGAVCDRFGALASLMLCAAFAAIPATLMPWVGGSYHAVVWMRILEGSSMGFVIPAMGAVVAIWFPLHERGLAGGIVGASIPAGSAAGLVCGPAIFALTKDWRAMSAWVSIVAWATLVLTLIAILVSKSRPSFHAHAEVAPASHGGTVFHRALMAPLTWVGILLTFMFAWSNLCIYSLTPAFLSANKPVGAGYGPMMSGNLMLGSTMAGIIGPLIAGVLLDKVFHGTTKWMMLIGFALTGVSIYALVIPAIVGSIPVLVVTLTMAGLGVYFVFPCFYVLLSKVYSNEIVGKMTGLWMGIGGFGGVTGLFLAGISVHRTGNYHIALILVALSAFVGLLLVFVLTQQQKRVAEVAAGKQAVHAIP